MSMPAKRAVNFVILSFSLLTAPSFVASSTAADAEWGCQILLCAASESPSWHGVPYCVPPMHKLITAMAKPGFSWPICPGAGTGAPNYEKYDDCPAGYTPSRSGNDDHGFSSSELNMCTRSVNTCKFGRRNRDDGCIQVQTISRPTRAKPYYFDIPQSTGVKQRFWFDLNSD